METYTEHTFAFLEQELPYLRLYIVDEHDSVRSALVDRLDQAQDLTVIGHGGEAKQVLTEVKSEKPDVVLVEIKRSDGMGLEILRQISTFPTPPRLAVLTTYPTAWEKEAAMKAGANSYILKDIHSEELIRKIAMLAES